MGWCDVGNVVVHDCLSGQVTTRPSTSDEDTAQAAAAASAVQAATVAAAKVAALQAILARPAATVLTVADLAAVLDSVGVSVPPAKVV